MPEDKVTGKAFSSVFWCLVDTSGLDDHFQSKALNLLLSEMTLACIRWAYKNRKMKVSTETVRVILQRAILMTSCLQPTLRQSEGCSPSNKQFKTPGQSREATPGYLPSALSQ